MILQGKHDEARALLAQIDDPSLAKQKEKLVAELPKASAE